MHTPIKTLLIANRSEVAARIQATAQQLGIATVCIYAQDDTAQAHLASADQVYPLSGTGSSAYLAQDEIIAIARQSGADAIHPGYGFLSEVGAFAKRVEHAGITFIGPHADTIALLGDKGTARELAHHCQVPVVPGATFAHTQAAHAEEYATNIGYPVLIKATGGGGGRGMAQISSSDEFAVIWQRIAQEGIRNYHSTDLVVEKFVQNPRHIEVQVAGDGTNAIHLFERDCSTQRRRQKIIEEAPAVGLPPSLRTQLHEAATRLITAANYRGIATVEFMVTADGQFYFLEVNTRLQVEHGVTEMITGIDLVALQLHIAQHHELPYTQDNVTTNGHAIQCRVYAEDPTADFTPSTGTIFAHHTPPLLFGRIEHSLELPHRVNGLYDPMLSKLITYGATREQARTRMTHLLSQYRLVGITTNIGFLRHICYHALFTTAAIHTQSMDELLATFALPTAPDNLAAIAAGLSTLTQPAPTTTSAPTPRSAWKEQQWK